MIIEKDINDVNKLINKYSVIIDDDNIIYFVNMEEFKKVNDAIYKIIHYMKNINSKQFEYNYRYEHFNRDNMPGLRFTYTKERLI